MAGELTVTLAFTHAKNGVTSSNSVSAQAIDVAGDLISSGVVSVGTSEEAIPMGEVVSAGWAFFENLDATNFVEIRAGTGVADTIKLLPGEAACFRLTTNAPYWIADTSACLCTYIILSV